MDKTFRAVAILNPDMPKESAESFNACSKQFINKEKNFRLFSRGNLLIPVLKKTSKLEEPLAKRDTLDYLYDMKNFALLNLSEINIENRIHLNREIKELQSKRIDPFQSLLLASFYLKIGNQAKAEDQLSFVMKKSIFEHANYPDQMVLGQKKKIISAVYQLLDFLDNSGINKSIIENFIIYLSKHVEEDFADEILARFDISVSLTNLRKRMKSFTWGHKYPQIWFDLAIKNMNDGEVLDYLRASFQAHMKTGNRDYPIHLFRWWIPTDEKSLDFVDQIFRKIDLKIKSQSIFYIEALNNNAIVQRDFDKRMPSKSVFNFKRDFFWNLLRAQDSVFYAFYELLAMGDITEESLYYLSIYE